METFGQYLNRFAKATNIVPDAIWDSVLEAVQDYLKKHFDVKFCALLVPTTANQQPGLMTEWHPGGHHWFAAIKNPDGSYNGQTAYAYEQRKNLWIVSREPDGLLAKVSQFEDLLGESEPDKIPPFIDLNNADIRTSIITVLQTHDNRHIGVLNIESARRLKPTVSLKAEVQRIAEALALLYILKRTYKIQKQSTQHTVDNLRRLSDRPLRDLHSLFLAYSSQADQEVMSAIRLAVAKFDVQIFDWGTDTRAGSIHEHIWDSLSRAGLCLCYFSEPEAQGGAFRYRDNPNVLFEAGIMYALAANESITAWIPVREENSPSLPFDFSAQRILRVPRGQTGALIKDRFIDDLVKWLREVGLPAR